MSAEMKITENFELEWCVSLPTKYCQLNSPVFSIGDNEFILKFALQKAGDYSFYDSYLLYLEFKSKLADFRAQCGNVKAGFKNKRTLTLKETLFQMSGPGRKEIWCITENDLQENSDYLEGNSIKFLFTFNSMPFIKKDEKESKASIGCQVPEKIWMSSKTVHFEALSRDFSKLLNESSRGDVKIICDGQTFSAHRTVLEVRSAVLSAMLNSDMVEGKSGSVKVEDTEASVFECFLNYLYSGTLPELNVENAKKFYDVADKYAVDEFKKACSEFLTDNLSKSNVCEMLVLADQHSDDDFRKDVISFMIEKEIPEDGCCWPDFCKNYSTLAIEVLNLYVRKLRARFYELNQISLK